MMHRMCLLAILYRMVEGCPVLVAANREEFYERQGTPPEIWKSEPAFMAGRDPRAGGTWLGVNQFGLLVAVTNRRKKQPPPAPRSRGLLCRELLACNTASAAHARALAETARGHYAGFNLLMIDRASGFVMHADEQLRSSTLSPGMHVMTASDLNDIGEARTAHALQWLKSRGPQPLEGWLNEIPRLCSDHGSPRHPAICLHGADRGTVSSSIVALADHPDDSRWLHAQGSPCRDAYADYSHVIATLLTARTTVPKPS